MTENYPNLFIPGAAKSGTSTLHNLLHLHQDICMTSLKEPLYLVNDDFDDNISAYNQKYSELFIEKPDAIFKGDSSTSYMLFPNFIERIKKHLTKDLKFIFVLRNPIDRIYSHYWYLKGLGSENNNLRDAINNDIDTPPNMSQRLAEGKFKNYYQFGLYGKWLSKFYDNFDEDQIKIIVFEDLKEHPLKTINSCLTFLGLKGLDSVSEIKSNKTIILKYPRIHKTILKIINGNVKVLKPINKLIPKPIKEYIKKNSSEFIINKTKSNRSYPALSDEDRLWIKDLYLEDINILKDITGKSFIQWSDFNLTE